MARIGATLSGLERTLLNRLSDATTAAEQNTLRLATMQRINYPSDNPSRFVGLSDFRSQLSVVGNTLANVTAANSLVSQAELTIEQIRTQLENIRELALADEDQALTAQQRTANQSAIDSAIAEVNRLAGLRINGRRLLDGSADFATGGRDAEQVIDLNVYARPGGASNTISGTVTSAATQATLTYTGASGDVIDTATITLEGDRGTVSLSVTAGEDLTAVRDRINAESHRTGVTATVAGDVLTFTSIAYGSEAEIAVEATAGGPFSTAGTGVGTDAAATINGHAVTGAGNLFLLDDDGLRFSMEFAGGFSGAFDAITVSGSALRFVLSTDLSAASTLAIPGVQASRLGGASGKLTDLALGSAYAGLGANAPRAVRIVDEAIARIDQVAGSVGGFARAAIDSSAALLDGLETSLTETINSIDGVNRTEEQPLLAKNNLLAQNAIAGLSIIDAQRQSIVQLIQRVAGLS